MFIVLQSFVFVCSYFANGLVFSPNTSRRLKVFGHRFDVFFITYSVLMTSTVCASDTHSSARDDSARQTKCMVYVVGHEGAPRRIFPDDGDCLTAELVLIY